MTNREKCILLLDSFSEEQLGNIALMLQAIKDLIDGTQDELNNKCQRKVGIAEGKFVCPDNIDTDNETIAKLFNGDSNI